LSELQEWGLFSVGANERTPKKYGATRTVEEQVSVRKCHGTYLTIASPTTSNRQSDGISQGSIQFAPRMFLQVWHLNDLNLIQVVAIGPEAKLEQCLDSGTS